MPHTNSICVSFSHYELDMHVPVPKNFNDVWKLWLLFVVRLNAVYSIISITCNIIRLSRKISRRSNSVSQSSAEGYGQPKFQLICLLDEPKLKRLEMHEVTTHITPFNFSSFKWHKHSCLCSAQLLLDVWNCSEFKLPALQALLRYLKSKEEQALKSAEYMMAVKQRIVERYQVS